MTDKERLIDLFTKFGIGFKVNPIPHHTLGGDKDKDYVVCDEGQDKIVGYCRFFCSFEFDKAGKFILMDIGE